MALQASGQITLEDLAAEFGGSQPHSLSEYYRGGGLVPDNSANANVPTGSAGTQIALSNFYGAKNITTTVRTVSADQMAKQYSSGFPPSSWVAGAGWNTGGSPNYGSIDSTSVLGQSLRYIYLGDYDVNDEDTYLHIGILDTSGTVSQNLFDTITLNYSTYNSTTGSYNPATNNISFAYDDAIFDRPNNVYYPASNNLNPILITSSKTARWRFYFGGPESWPPFAAVAQPYRINTVTFVG